MPHTDSHVTIGCQAGKRGGTDGDELIISGDGAGCWDDEDCSAYSTDPAPSDDLITPRIVMVSARPPYNPVQQGFRTSTARPRDKTATCSDDEDCFEGSADGSDGDDDDDDDRSVGGQRLVSTTLRPPHGGSPSISYSWSGLRTPVPTPYYARPAPPTPFEDKSIMFTSKPIPPDEPVVSETMVEKARPSPPPRPTGPRVIIDVPKPNIPHHHNREKDRTVPPLTSRHPSHPPSSSSSLNKSSRTALAIGVIAVIIIVIVILAPLLVVLRVKYRSAVPKSIDNRNNYQFNSVSGTPQILLPNPTPGTVSHLTGAGPPVAGDFKQAPQLPQKKDLKEWYV